MRKIYFLLFICATIFMSCTQEISVVVNGDSLNFRLYNYSDNSFQNGELFIGAKDANGDFIATESISYTYIPSKHSPNDAYTNLDNCIGGNCGTNGLIDGYHYFRSNGEIFVSVPFTPTNNTWNPNLEDVLAISDNMMLMLRLSDGSETLISGFNLRTTLIDNPAPVNAIVRMYIRENKIEGTTSF
jgi:hypothetical protein